MLVLLVGGVYECGAEMASGGIKYLPSLTMIGSGIRVILGVLAQQFEGQRCWYY
jgi:hypothetical protein